MFLYGLESALSEKASDVSDLFVVIERVVPMVRRSESHLLAAQLHLEVFLLGLLGRAAESLKHVDDIAPMNIVRRRMRKDLPEGVLCLV